MDAEEILLGGRGHGEGVPLQLGDGRAVDEDVLAHLHLEAVLHQLQLQHLGRPHHDLQAEQRDGCHRSVSNWQKGAGEKRDLRHTLLYLTVCR